MTFKRIVKITQIDDSENTVVLQPQDPRDTSIIDIHWPEPSTFVKIDDELVLIVRKKRWYDMFFNQNYISRNLQAESTRFNECWQNKTFTYRGVSWEIPHGDYFVEKAKYWSWGNIVLVVRNLSSGEFYKLLLWDAKLHCLNEFEVK